MRTDIDRALEDAIQVSYRLQGATDLLKLHRKELAEVTAKLGDVVAEKDAEESKRDCIATYRATLAQVDLAIAALASSPVQAKELQAQIEESLLRNLAILVSSSGGTVESFNRGVVYHGIHQTLIDIDATRDMLKSCAANLAAGLADSMVRR